MDLFLASKIATTRVLRILAALAALLVFIVSADSAENRYGATHYPPKGRVLHIAGQSREDFDDYVARVSQHGTACPIPSGASLYTNLLLQGLTAPSAISAGDTHQDLPSLAKKYANLVLHVGLYLHHLQLNQIAKGQHDEALQRLGKLLAATHRPVYLRIGYEFDGPHNQYSPEEYRVAYRRCVEKIDRAGAKNIAYVWHSYALTPTFGDHDPAEWYPGDRYVSWIGISFFQAGSNGQITAPNRTRLVAIAKEKELPVMICEASAISARANDGSPLTGDEYWAYWFKPFFDFIDGDNNVRAFAIIHCDWDALSITKHFGWGNCRITRDPYVLQQWREKMQCKKFIHQTPNLDKLLSFSGGTDDALLPEERRD